MPMYQALSQQQQQQQVRHDTPTCVGLIRQVAKPLVVLCAYASSSISITPHSRTSSEVVAN